MGKPDVHSPGKADVRSARCAVPDSLGWGRHPDMFYPELAKSLMLLTISSSPGQSLAGTRRTIDHTGAWWWGIRCGTREVVSLTKPGLCLSFRWCTINFSMYLKWPTLLRALNIICLIISAEMRYWTSWCGAILNNVLSFNVIDRIFLPSKRFYIASQLKILYIGVITYRPFSALGSKLGQRVKSPNFKEYGSFWSNVHPCILLGRIHFHFGKQMEQSDRGLENRYLPLTETCIAEFRRFW